MSAMDVVKAGPWCTQKQLSEFALSIQGEVLKRVNEKAKQNYSEPVTNADSGEGTDTAEWTYRTTNDNYGEKFGGRFKANRISKSECNQASRDHCPQKHSSQ